MHHFASTTLHCINPQCSIPANQPSGNRFCQSCGAPLELNGRYIPLNCLGTGGFSALYTVWDMETQTEKVLKVLIDTAPKALQLFEQEASILAQLRHPGIPQVEPDGYFFLKRRNSIHTPVPCLVMEKIHGPTLEQVLTHCPDGCPEIWVMDWLNQTLDILRELHRYQIVHRDLKPSNLMLCSTPTFPLDRHQLQDIPLVMIDFGGAKQMQPRLHPSTPAALSGVKSRSATRLVSPGYSPPEQITGSSIGPATDFYALGQTCIHLLTGIFPADLESVMAAEMQWRDCASVTPRMANLIDQMVLPDMAQRPQTAVEIQTALLEVVRYNKYPRRHMSLPELCFDLFKTGLIQLDKGLTALGRSVGQFVVKALNISLETVWEMGLAGIGGVIGATIGFTLIYWTSLDDYLIQLLSQQFPQFASSSEISLEQLTPSLLVSGLAGLGTAVGLTDAEGISQDRRYGFAGALGALGYAVGSLGTQLADSVSAFWGLPLGLAAAMLTIGLRISSHQVIYVVGSALGVSSIFKHLSLEGSFPLDVLRFPLVNSGSPDAIFWMGLAFTGILGCSIGLCLSIIHYLVVPVLRWLGWR
ncbi:MAG: protein kinase [Microcoleaceae cyanobacterium]